MKDCLVSSFSTEGVYLGYEDIARPAVVDRYWYSLHSLLLLSFICPPHFAAVLHMSISMAGTAEVSVQNQSGPL
jgi:hypothetical protein